LGLGAGPRTAQIRTSGYPARPEGPDILEVFHAERLHFKVVELNELVDRGVLEADTAETLLRAACEKFKGEYVPIIHGVLKP